MSTSTTPPDEATMTTFARRLHFLSSSQEEGESGAPTEGTPPSQEKVEENNPDSPLCYLIRTPSPPNQMPTTKLPSIEVQQPANISLNSSCEAFYNANGLSKLVLMAMAIGLYSEESLPLYDPDMAPFKNARQKKAFSPHQKHILAQEIARRGAIMNKDVRCKSWPIKRLTTWLETHPIQNASDVAFVTKKTKEFRDMMTNAHNAYTTRAFSKGRVDEDGNKKENWHSNPEYCRLYHCLAHDNVKDKYIAKDAAKTRLELDAKGSPSEESSWDQLAADLFNDPSFCPWSNKYPHLHPDFEKSMDLSLDKMPAGKITPGDVRSRQKYARMAANKVSIFFV